MASYKYKLSHLAVQACKNTKFSALKPEKSRKPQNFKYRNFKVNLNPVPPHPPDFGLMNLKTAQESTSQNILSSRHDNFFKH